MKKGNSQHAVAKATNEVHEPVAHKLLSADLAPEDIVAPTYGDHTAATIQEAIEDLFELGLVNSDTKKEFDEALLSPAAPFPASKIIELRHRECASQVVLARYLGVSVNTVSQWERGERRATGTSAKLLRLVEKHGLAYIR